MKTIISKDFPNRKISKDMMVMHVWRDDRSIEGVAAHVVVVDLVLWYG